MRSRTTARRIRRRDEPLPPETFVFEPPPGETIEDVAEHRALREQPIEDVARRATFTVLIAAGLEEPWRMRAMYVASRRGQPHEHVHLHYYRDDATHSFAVNEQSADEPAFFTAVVEPERVEHRGATFDVIRPTGELPLGSVRLTRGGTSIEITSDNLELSELLDVAAGLRPALG